MIYKILLTWVFVGRMYMVCIAIYRSGETWRGLFTKRIYRQLIIEAGTFGYITPLFDWWLEKAYPKKEIKRNKTNLEKEFIVKPTRRFEQLSECDIIPLPCEPSEPVAATN